MQLADRDDPGAGARVGTLKLGTVPDVDEAAPEKLFLLHRPGAV
jgi:hypothetical protein